MTALPVKGNLDGATAGHNEGMFQVAIGALRDFCADLFGTTGTSADAFAALRLLDSEAVYNLKPTFAMGSNALTITLGGNAAALSVTNPGFLTQRSSVIGDGGFNLRSIVANLSLVITAGSTLGHVADRLSPIYGYLLDVSSSVQELVVSGSFQGETGIFTTVAEGGGGGADTITNMYSATQRTNLPGRLVFIAWFNNTVAGNWVNAAAEVKQRPFLLKEAGEIVDYGGGTVPYGYFLQDGSNQVRATYGKLFGKIGTAFGAGDGTTFSVGDSRRRALVGSGGTGNATLGNAVGNTGGSETIAAAALPASGLSIPGLSIPGLSIPGLSIPGLSIPGLSIPALGVPTKKDTGSPNTDPAGIKEQLPGDGVTTGNIAGGTHATNGGTTGGGTTGGGTTGGGTTGGGTTGGGTTGNMGSATPHFPPALVVTKMIRWLGDI